MPIIKSRVHADELCAARDALAAANRDADALRRQLLEQREQLAERTQQGALLAAKLAQAETRLKEAHHRLAEAQSYAQVREAHHIEQMHRLEQNVRTLEDMVQAARRSERERSNSVYHYELSVDDDSAKHAERARRGAEEAHCQVRHSQKSPASQRPPSVPARDDKAVRELRRSPISAQTLYWQEQLLDVSQLASEGFSEVQWQLRGCLPSSSPATSQADAVGDAQPDSGPFAASASLDADVHRWGRQLRHLQAHFDEVVQADARLISFLLLVVQQQSQQVRGLQERWAEAQSTVRDAETMLAEADARVTGSHQESMVLRQECAALTQMQATLQAELTYRTREHQTAVSALRRLQEAHAQLTEAHTRQEEIWATRLTQATEVQQRASTYAKKLEAALLDKERLMSAAVASSEERHRRETLSAAKERVAVFMRQLNASAQQLQSSLASLSGPTPSSALAASTVVAGAVKTVSSVTSPEPSPPGVSSSPHSSSSAAALYSRVAVATAASPSPEPSPPTFDESILLPESAPAALL
ncbi:hypothetical protein GH5_07928 [Leishmania sp. Ghana 2012 LV757]|uniref:hypothetical protein n=1 Tax=Leishmania sp. Ghana 2012 LV757 TaxID=2803181 RepID=UPI001B4F40CA|nr:hypothetical protein GH5_07928 [Leishmania sp. Ghana 2012 LV757]